jgi:uracil phosphoribosyltransferase
MPVYPITHPVIRHKVTMLRDPATNAKDFRGLVTEISTFLAYEATKNLPLTTTTMTGWQGNPIDVRMVKEKDPSIVSILRAGIGMQEGFLQVIPTARISYIGYYRDETTLEPKKYYTKLAVDVQERRNYILDPMLATGGTTSAACTLLKRAGVKDITVLCIIAAPEGIRRVTEEHPDVDIIPAAIDSHLSEQGHIIPGLGDAGDRLFGTR